MSPPSDPSEGTGGPRRRGWLARWSGPPDVRTNVLFYDWIRSTLRPDDRVLDAGAGPGPRDPVRRLRGEVARVCGIDIDPAVLANDALDEARVLQGPRWPYPDASFDLVLSDYVLEHLERPADYLAEARRVLKPGRPFFFRTVNALHPGVCVGRWLPLRTWTALVRWLDPEAGASRDPYPAMWRANTPARLRALLRAAGFRRVDLRTREEPPTYLARLGPLAWPAVLWCRLADRWPALAPLRITLFGCAR